MAQWQRICWQYRSHRKVGFDPWVRKIPLWRKWQPAAIFLPGESHGQRNLVGYSPWGCKSRTWLKRLSMHACMHEIFYWLGCSGLGFVFSFSTCLWVDFYDWCGIPQFTHLIYISCLIFDEGNWAVLSSALWAGYPRVNIAMWETRASRSTRNTSFEKRSNYPKLDQAKGQAKTVLFGKSRC